MRVKWRGDKNTTERGYGGKWQRARIAFLKQRPLCVFCNAMGYTTAAQVVDHILPHNGDQKLFWDRKNWQPLCKACHDGIKARIEHNNHAVAFDQEGWPIPLGGVKN